ncbi:transcriptional regulator containing an amidase domain and an AraC-type DNA-binding HTH domain [Rhizobium leguminosarum bv. trifolii WSM597]|uniref:Transcriptional regulator containing an amidase domain and an AraC-type DNA-binding HTH domain n=1 Tax=Rhizobium leguminosarum bv. trifolii WSM597 TaxID=754764 RepID=J0H291_RHILT|nr:GlxA family transcriptional regulator [Rhizobium leguminosarum]EJB04135.1 transcriptional regulator containing an amidase domain and an AraC-type DNA-binding HTH domain [Rhizobium leguminosarum bv. trifolii WSM597]
MPAKDTAIELLILVTPSFNLAATTAFIDPFRAANYLDGATRFKWTLASTAGGPCVASNGIVVETGKLSDIQTDSFAIVVMSASWTPETGKTPQLLAALRKWARGGSIIGGLDTGAMILADAGLLKGARATVHYEHIDAFKELHEDIDVSEDIFVHDETRFTCSGGIASADIALHLIRASAGDALANAAARYIFHPSLRPAGTSQNPAGGEPLGSHVPFTIRQAITAMEQHLENALSIPDIAAKVKISHRQLNRLFLRYVGKSPAIYYRDIRLDRARGLVTQTDMPMSEITIACGFASQVHFSRAYRERFGLSPRTDRVDGRIPFEFRAWPMHRKTDGNA